MKTQAEDKNTEPEIRLSISQYQQLLDERNELREEQNKLLSREEAYLQEINRLQCQIYDLLRRCWGKKSEKRLPDSPDQLSICWQTPQDSAPAQQLQEEAEKSAREEEKSYSRFRKSFQDKKIHPHGPKCLPAEIERIADTPIDPEGDLQGCVLLGQEITEKLEVMPARVYVRQIIRNKYKTPDGRILIAPLPTQALWRSHAGASALSHIIVGKYADHLPLHRQLGIFQREGVRLSPSTVSNWCLAAAQEVEPIYNELRELLRKQSYVMADETPAKVLESDRPHALHQGYMWAFYLPFCRTPFYEYHKGRGKEGVGVLLDCSVRVVQSDGYSVYGLFDELPGYLHLCCWAHARRKFIEAEWSDPPRVREILELIGRLYEIEKEIKSQGYQDEEKVNYRQRYAYPILQSIENWLKRNRVQVTAGSALDKAMQYTYSRMEQLSLYISAAAFEIDNNAIERQLRPLTLNRKNTLFIGSHEAAHASAIYYTLLGCCREHGVNPKTWLEDVLIRIKACAPTDYSSLIPFNWKKIQ